MKPSRPGISTSSSKASASRSIATRSASRPVGRRSHDLELRHLPEHEHQQLEIRRRVVHDDEPRPHRYVFVDGEHGFTMSRVVGPVITVDGQPMLRVAGVGAYG